MYIFWTPEGNVFINDPVPGLLVSHSLLVSDAIFLKTAPKDNFFAWSYINGKNRWKLLRIFDLRPKKTSTKDELQNKAALAAFVPELISKDER